MSDKPNRSDPHWSTYHWKYITALAKHYGMRHAQIIKQAFAEKLERIPDNKSAGITKEYLDRLYMNMTSEERKHPER